MKTYRDKDDDDEIFRILTRWTGSKSYSNRCLGLMVCATESTAFYDERNGFTIIRSYQKHFSTYLHFPPNQLIEKLSHVRRTLWFLLLFSAIFDINRNTKVMNHVFVLDSLFFFRFLKVFHAKLLSHFKIKKKGFIFLCRNSWHTEAVAKITSQLL